MLQCGRYKSMDIVGYLKSVLQEARPYTRMKLMLVGLQVRIIVLNTNFCLPFWGMHSLLPSPGSHRSPVETLRASGIARSSPATVGAGLQTASSL